MDKKKLFLIDGNSLCYRAYYAIRELSTSCGRPTNAIYGFINMLRKIVKEERPDYLAVAFDLKWPTFRHKLFEDYKIQRRPMPDALIEQMPAIKQVISFYNIPVFEKAGYEADDILATITAKLKNSALQIYIVSGDKDTLQLVDENVFICNPYHKEINIYNRKKVMERFGVGPEMIPALLAMAGDAADNIPGIKGIGEKTARALLERFQSLEGLLSHLEEVEKEDLRRSLRENQDLLKLNRKLVVLDKDVPLEVQLDELKIRQPKIECLIKLFKELEFKNLLKELIREGKSYRAADFRRIHKREELEELIAEIKEKKEFAFELYTQRSDAAKARITVGLALYCGESCPCLIQLSGGKQNELPRSKLRGVNSRTNRNAATVPAFGGIEFADLEALFEDSSCGKVCYDLKRAMSILDRENISVKGDTFDVMLAAYLIDPSKTSYTLEDIAFEYLNNFPQLESIDAAVSGSEAVRAVFGLHSILKKILEEKNLLNLYEEVEMPLVKVLFSMERKGVHLDLDFLSKMSGQLNKEISRLKKEIIQAAGRDFNLDSPKQLRKVLFDDLRLPVIKKVKTGPSTDEEVLKKLSAVHKLPELILKYRELAKLKSTYVDSLCSLAEPQTGRIHTTFEQTGTETGRLSSRNPNLQNIPVRTEFARQIRRAISSQNGDYLLLSADYSQIELRILAHLSADKALISAFEGGRDIHKDTASLIFSLPEEKIDRNQRSIAKTVNFGIIYGMSSFGLSKELNIEIDKAEEFIKAYFQRYPGVKSYIEAKIKEAREDGFVTTILKRRRFVPAINSPQQSVKQFAERTAVNTPIQGSAADIIKLAMLGIYEKIRAADIDAELILQIHDELLFESHKDSLGALIKIVSSEMENVVKLKVPLKVSLKVGGDWLEMKPVELSTK